MLFTVANIPNYRNHFEQHYPLSSRRIKRAGSAIEQYIRDLALNENEDGVGHTIGNETYEKTLEKLQIVMYKYLYMGWSVDEFQMVMGDQ